MIYRVVFSIGAQPQNMTRGSGRKNDKTILVPEASSRGDALLKAAAQMKDEDVYGVTIDSMEAEILGR